MHQHVIIIGTTTTIYYTQALNNWSETWNHLCISVDALSKEGLVESFRKLQSGKLYIGSTLLRLDSFRRAFMWIFLHFCQVKTIYELFVKSKLEKKNYVMLRQKWKKMPTDSRTKNVRLRNMSAYFIKTHMFTIFCLSLAETIDTQKPSFSLQRACTLCQKF